PISAKSDVYALGLILYELLTGQPPYALPRDGSVEEVRQVITEATPPPLRQSNTAYGEELEAILAVALAKRPADRIWVAVLRSRLERYLQKLPSEIDRPRHETHTAQWDVQPVHRQSDRGIARSEVRPQVWTGVSSPPAPATPMPGEPHSLDQAD